MDVHMNYQELMKAVIKEAHLAGEVLSAEWQRPSGPRGSGDKADVDIEIETLVRASLLRILSCDYWGEETGSSLQGTEHCWVVDPNDGTADFLNGLKGSAISIGLLCNGKPVLGVVYAPVTESRGPDCIAWSHGMNGIYRNGEILERCLEGGKLEKGTRVLVSTAARKSFEMNAKLCAPAEPIPTTSIAYRLAAVAAGDAIAGVSLVPTSAHDVVAGHAILIGAGGVLLDEKGNPVTYDVRARFAITSKRCFGGAAAACHELVFRGWDEIFRRQGKQTEV
jgi:myo-inositol-1(or 4)-monophosphatase